MTTYLISLTKGGFFVEEDDFSLKVDACNMTNLCFSSWFFDILFEK